MICSAWLCFNLFSCALISLLSFDVFTSPQLFFFVSFCYVVLISAWYATCSYVVKCFAMLHYAVVCGSMLCYVVLRCRMIRCCPMLCYVVPCCGVLCYFFQFVPLCCAVLCLVEPCCAISFVCCAVLCRIVLCCGTYSYVFLSCAKMLQVMPRFTLLCFVLKDLCIFYWSKNIAKWLLKFFFHYGSSVAKMFKTLIQSCQFKQQSLPETLVVPSFPACPD